MDSLAQTAGVSDAFSRLSEKDKAELQVFLRNESQKSNIQQSIHKLTDVCFKKCITSNISVATLDKYEEPCMQNCVERFLDANKLVMNQLQSMRG
ncbi:putative mitochondrial import inner membrane translocase subunit tim8 protein [Venturia nashicola]|uniref:Mitochondrial import inner membrane translocase subunit n=1 Tax=Venturia nashicola TaxID=86259 RepID=A0A4Z1P671_9PEZI|nr:putative mitochondrial import inner membrane translocase subunit tim8 protein [Venturia nashicola]TLD23451.1 putative mitochondrial import inner membrane translocase subunit tim8 protein [Venturia nashicola]